MIRTQGTARIASAATECCAVWVEVFDPLVCEEGVATRTSEDKLLV
ncbi:MAG TPA: hypothetical protein VEB03_00785 [Candidatus Nanoarchaeia archaeon]|nr:hypothetical protein [Candidatus Nanoarchaeia archaeon]